MNLGKVRSLIIPIFALLIFCWVFNRPISAFALFIYNNTAAHFNNTVRGLKKTKQDAEALLHAEELAAKLEKENRELIINKTSLESQIAKTQQLEKSLQIKSQFKYRTITAAVIGRSPDAWHDQFIINKGSQDGIKVGRGVINEDGVIGQIKKVGRSSSVVQLISNPDWRMGVKVARLNQYCILNGNYPEKARLQFITIDSDIQAGDEIVSSGVCTDNDKCPYPENFPVGKVVMVGKDPNEIDLVVEVEYYADLNKTKYVFVLE
jgi:rod shape-determining protein MreC